jgi:Leu/Phe-tRNA-protein transferase
MFAKVSNASKAGFIWFVEKYKNKFDVIDCQVIQNIWKVWEHEVFLKDF